MGETASTWKHPLHSSDSEHPEQTRRNFRGHGRAMPATDSPPAPMFQRGGKQSRASRQPVGADEGNPFHAS